MILDFTLLKLAQIRSKSRAAHFWVAISIFILWSFYFPPPPWPMWSTNRQIAAGDTVIVWLTRDQIQPLVVTPGKDFNTKFGNFKQADFVGVPYGSKVVPKSGRGFIYILRPTPELWTLALPHRTQILYLADIAFITSYLGIKKGSKVIEAGMP